MRNSVGNDDGDVLRFRSVSKSRKTLVPDCLCQTKFVIAINSFLSANNKALGIASNFLGREQQAERDVTAGTFDCTKFPTQELGK